MKKDMGKDLNNKMFCFQCEQTAGCAGCMGAAGVCGKTANTSRLQDELTGAVIGLAKSCGHNEKSERTDRIIIEGLFTTVTNVNFNDKTLEDMIEKVHKEKEAIAPNCITCAAPCGNTEDFDMNLLWNEDEDIRSLKSLILFGIRGMAAYAYHAMVLGYESEEVNQFFYKALSIITYDLEMDRLIEVAMEVGEKNLKCMELLDKANTSSYGTPTPVKVPLTIEKGPFIVITGHDLKDLEVLLKQTEGKGINIYTHGEMLPAHGYPELKKYPHLKGNFGTAWQNQQKEFDNIPRALIVLITRTEIPAHTISSPASAYSACPTQEKARYSCFWFRKIVIFVITISYRLRINFFDFHLCERLSMTVLLVIAGFSLILVNDNFLSSAFFYYRSFYSCVSCVCTNL